MRLITTPLVAVLLALSLPGAASASDTPEAAVGRYLAAVARADVEQVLATTAVDEMTQGYRFDEAVGWAAGFSALTTAGPVHTPFFADLQHADWTARLLVQTRMLAYSLLAPDVLGNDGLLGKRLEADAAWATGLMAELDPARLSSLAVVDVKQPRPDRASDEGYLASLARWASLYGADEQVDRVALFSFEDDLYVVGFTLLRYGDEWKVGPNTSSISGISPIGFAWPITREGFVELTTE